MDTSKLFKRKRKMDIIISSILAVVGIILMLNPKSTLYAIGIIFGITSIVFGIYKSIKFLSKKETIETDKKYANEIVIGIMAIIGGIVSFIYIVIIESLLRIIIGLWIVYNGIIKIAEAEIFRCTSAWWPMVISSGVTLILGLYVTFYSGALITIFGAIILIYSIVNIIQTIIYEKKENKVI